MDIDKDTIELIKERYFELPQHLQEAVTASDLPAKMKTIANNHGLMIDQLGSLRKEIILVMLGLESSSIFVKNVSKELEVDEKKSLAIAKDVESLIFSPIKSYLREWEEEENRQLDIEEAEKESLSTISSIEQAGGFSIEKEKIDPKKTRPDGAWKMPEEGEIELPEEILRHIEEHKLPTKPANTTLTPISTTTPKPAPLVTPVLEPQTITNPPTSNSVPISSPVKSSWEKDNEQHTEPLVDHLLTKTTSIPLEKSSQQITEMPKKSAPIPNNIPTGPDMYHEPIE